MEKIPPFFKCQVPVIEIDTIFISLFGRVVVHLNYSIFFFFFPTIPTLHKENSNDTTNYIILCTIQPRGELWLVEG